MKGKILALVMGLLISTNAYGFGFGTSKFAAEVGKEGAAVKLVREVVSGEYGVITTEELKGLIESGDDVVIVDTMPYEASYKKGHIPGAVQFLFPIPEMGVWDTDKTGGKTRADYEKLLGPDRHKKIIVYCGFVKCTRSHNGALWAKRLGYTNVFRHPGGIYAWKGAEYGLELEK